jgi:ACS family hexuronate transporter-like MFS transporter
MSVLLFSSTLNFLDRQLLAALAPSLKTEFGLSNQQYGGLISAFSLPYMIVTPFAGMLVDRIGLNFAVTLAVGLWSIAGALTGLSRTFAALQWCRAGLGFSEAASIPCASKGTALYLEQREWGLGTASAAVGITLGSIAAPLVVVALSPFGWRAVFVICGSLGFIWIPVWLWTAKLIPSKRMVSGSEVKFAIRRVLTDKRMWGLMAANILIMTVYSLWTNWTTVYLVDARHLTQSEANKYFAWIPPVFATLGGFFGGFLAMRAIRSGKAPLVARFNVCKAAAPALLLTAAIPLMPSTALAVLVICLSFFVCMTILMNLHVMPIDLFGPERAGLTASLLTFSYAIMQTLISPVIGRAIDQFGFGGVCAAASVLPVVGVLITGISIRLNLSTDSTRA